MATEDEDLLVTPEEIAEVGEYWTGVIQDPEVSDEDLTMGLCYLTLYNIAIESSKDGLDTSLVNTCLLYTSPSPRDRSLSRMPSSA